jgi:hypothetical protein
MNEEQKEELKSYRLQIVFLFIVVFAILIAFSYLQDLINKVKYGVVNKSELFKKNYIISSIFVFISFGYVIITFKNYIKRKDNETFLALIEAIFLLIASLIRLFNLKKNQERY